MYGALFDWKKKTLVDFMWSQRRKQCKNVGMHAQTPNRQSEQTISVIQDYNNGVACIFFSYLYFSSYQPRKSRRELGTVKNDTLN